MKMKTKKILAGICIGIAGMGLLSGCSLSDEQMEAVDKLTKNTETLVDSLDRYLESSNSKLDKNTAFDMLREARMKSMYIWNDVNVMSIQRTTTNHFDTTKSEPTINLIIDHSTNVYKAMTVTEDGQIGYVEKLTLSENENSYQANYTFDDNNSIEKLQKLSDKNYKNIQLMDVDMFTNSGIYQLTVDDITNVKYENGEYTFNLIKTNIDTASQTNGEVFKAKFTRIFTVVVEDYMFKSVKMDIIVEKVDDNTIIKDTENNLIEDGYGSYVTRGEIINYATVQTNYLYCEDVDLTLLNNKIAEIDAKIESGELTFA